MQTAIVSTDAALHDLREEWERLEQADPGVPYYVTFRYVAAWWDAFSGDPHTDLTVIALRNNGTLVAIAPLAIRTEQRKRGRVRVVRFAGLGDYLAFLLDPDENPDVLCKHLMRAVESDLNWDVVALTNIPAPSPLAGFLFRSEHNASFTVHTENPYVDLRRYDDFEEFCRHHLPGKVRKYRNKLFRENELHFRVVRGNADGIFARMADLHSTEKQYLVEEQSREERYSLFEDPLRAEHVRNVYSRTSDTVTFVYETASGELVGYRTCYVQDRTLLSWNSAYHPDFIKYRIGKAIQYDIFEHLFADRWADIFDFGAGRYPWKFEWTDEFSTTYRLNLRTARPPAPAVDHVAESPRDEALRQPRHHDTGGSRDRSGRLGQARAVARRLGLGRAKRLGARAKDVLVARSRPPIIWYAPHPDDETIFMGGSIRAHADRRNILVMLTRGGGSGAIDIVNKKLDEPLSREAFMGARLRELTAAVRTLGIRDRDFLIHDLPDGQLTEDAVLGVMTGMASRYPRASHRTMSFLDPHRDHATAGRALREAFRRGVVRDCTFHLPVPLVPDGLGSAADLSPDAVAGKRAALREYERWDPAAGRYAIGAHSVKKLIRDQRRAPCERVHGPDYEGPNDGGE